MRRLLDSKYIERLEGKDKERKQGLVKGNTELLDFLCSIIEEELDNLTKIIDSPQLLQETNYPEQVARIIGSRQALKKLKHLLEEKPDDR